MLAVRKAHSEGSIHVSIYCKARTVGSTWAWVLDYRAEISLKWWKQYVELQHKKLCPIHQGVTIPIRWTEVQLTLTSQGELNTLTML